MKKQQLVEMSLASLVSDAHHTAPPAILPALTVGIFPLHSLTFACLGWLAERV